MEIFLDLLSWIAIIAGGCFCLIGAFGLIKLPDVYCRMHASGIVDTAGMGLILIGLACQAGITLALAKLALIAVFILLTSPTSCHALCRAAAYGGIHPLYGEQVNASDEVVAKTQDQEKLLSKT